MQAIILAAGKGTRMNSQVPKVLHKLGDRTLLGHVVEHLALFGIEHPIVVIGHQKELVRRAIERDFPKVQFVEQGQPLGTGHAVKAALPLLQSGFVFVLMGDAPLFSPTTLAGMKENYSRSLATITLASVHFDDDIAYGRLVRGISGSIVAIVERKNATPAQLEIREYNAGCYLFDVDWLKLTLPKLTKNSVSGEYYLTDLVAVAARQQKIIAAYPVGNSLEALPVNSQEELAVVEEVWQHYAG
jgi:bifunctional UDP-N-acetylglucosamine pyrophosphorylase/glucosamine-1-phosphate N-acetyltransferase